MRLFRQAAFIVLCQFILLASAAIAQRSDTTKVDSLHRAAFEQTSTEPLEQEMHGRIIDMAIGGGAGYYSRDEHFPIQGNVGIDFSGRTENLDLIAGYHHGFSTPSTDGLHVGMRFPIKERLSVKRGWYGDLAVLFFDDGADSGAFHTGLRAALVARRAPFEFRLSAELRNNPIEGRRFEGWLGVEAAVVIDLINRGQLEPTRRDTLRAAYRYIATSEELTGLEEAGSNREVDAWLDMFWAARAIKGTPVGSSRREFERRIALANMRFGKPSRMGVSSDMGRVLLVYGEPDDTEVAQSYVDASRRYELWIDHDRIHGFSTAAFLFLRSAGLSTGYDSREDREVYSNIPGEPSEGIPYDLPVTLKNFLRVSGR